MANQRLLYFIIGGVGALLLISAFLVQKYGVLGYGIIVLFLGLIVALIHFQGDTLSSFFSSSGGGSTAKGKVLKGAQIKVAAEPEELTGVARKTALANSNHPLKERMRFLQVEVTVNPQAPKGASDSAVSRIAWNPSAFRLVPAQTSPGQLKEIIQNESGGTNVLSEKPGSQNYARLEDYYIWSQHSFVFNPSDEVFGSTRVRFIFAVPPDLRQCRFAYYGELLSQINLPRRPAGAVPELDDPMNLEREATGSSTAQAAAAAEVQKGRVATIRIDEDGEDAESDESGDLSVAPWNVGKKASYHQPLGVELENSQGSANGDPRGSGRRPRVEGTVRPIKIEEEKPQPLSPSGKARKITSRVNIPPAPAAVEDDLDVEDDVREPVREEKAQPASVQSEPAVQGHRPVAEDQPIPSARRLVRPADDYSAAPSQSSPLAYEEPALPEAVTDHGAVATPMPSRQRPIETAAFAANQEAIRRAQSEALPPPRMASQHRPAQVAQSRTQPVQQRDHHDQPAVAPRPAASEPAPAAPPTPAGMIPSMDIPRYRRVTGLIPPPAPSPAEEALQLESHLPAAHLPSSQPAPEEIVAAPPQNASPPETPTQSRQTSVLRLRPEPDDGLAHTETAGSPAITFGWSGQARYEEQTSRTENAGSYGASDAEEASPHESVAPVPGAGDGDGPPAPFRKRSREELSAPPGEPTESGGRRERRITSNITERLMALSRRTASQQPNPAEGDRAPQPQPSASPTRSRPQTHESEPQREAVPGDYFLVENGQPYGPFPIEDLNRQVLAGELDPNEFTWTLGMSQWRTVSAVLSDKGLA